MVLKESNKNNYISHVLCRKYTELNNNSYIKDLSKLGRDLSKVCIVDNNKDNFCLQPENGLFISSYYGEQNDNELYSLCGDLMKIIGIQPDDIRTVIKKLILLYKEGILKICIWYIEIIIFFLFIFFFWFISFNYLY